MKKITRLSTIFGGASLAALSLGTVCACGCCTKGVTTYTVTFDLDGGSISGLGTNNKMTIVKGTTYGQLPTPKKTDYAFMYWTVGDDAISNLETVISSNVTVKAHYVTSSASEFGIIEPTTAASRVAPSNATYESNSYTYQFAFPGVFTAPSTSTITNLYASAILSCKVDDTTYSKNVYGVAEATTGQYFTIKLYAEVGGITSEDKINNKNFLTFLPTATTVNVSNFVIFDASKQLAYWCTNDYSIKINPNLVVISEPQDGINFNDQRSSYYASTGETYRLNLLNATNEDIESWEDIVPEVTTDNDNITCTAHQSFTINELEPDRQYPGDEYGTFYCEFDAGGVAVATDTEVEIGLEFKYDGTTFYKKPIGEEPRLKYTLKAQE